MSYLRVCSCGSRCVSAAVPPSGCVEQGHTYLCVCVCLFRWFFRCCSRIASGDPKSCRLRAHSVPWVIFLVFSQVSEWENALKSLLVFSF